MAPGAKPIYGHSDDITYLYMGKKGPTDNRVFPWPVCWWCHTKSSWRMKVMMMMMMKRRSLRTAVPTVTRWERVKRGRVGAWCGSLASDYTAACREAAVVVWGRPLTALTCLGLLGGAWACARTNPDEDSLRCALLRSSNRLGLLSARTRSVASHDHVQSLTRLRNEGRLRHLGLGVASLAWRADHAPGVCLYEASYLARPPWRELPGRVVDVGFAGRWWVLDARMKDCDVNEEEFQSLPAHMRATVPPTAREVERNESLHKASWLPLKMMEEEELEDSRQDAVVVVPEIVEEQKESTA